MAWTSCGVVQERDKSKAFGGWEIAWDWWDWIGRGA